MNENSTTLTSTNEKLLEEYKKAVDIGSIVSKTNSKGIITYVNEEFCKISGYSANELIGKNHNIVRHPDVGSEIYKDLWQTIKSKKVWKGKIKNLAKDGSAYYVKAAIVPILDDNQDIVEYLALRQNVTELEELNISLEKRVEEETRKNREKDNKHIESLKSFLEFSPNPIIVYKNQKVTYANSKFLNLIHTDESELIDYPFELDSIFEDKQGYIKKLSDIDPKSTTNKISISMKVGRSIFYLIVNEITSIDGEPLKMYTFNNITLIEYKQLKINHYTDRLEYFVKKINKKRYSDNIQKDETILETPQKDTEVPTMIDFDETPKSSRVLDNKERDVLKKSRDNIAISSEDYSNDIDDYILEEIDELSDLEGEISDLLTIFEENKDIHILKEISTKYSNYSSTLSQLIEFEDLAYAVKSLSDLLFNLQEKDVDESKHKKMELFLSNILFDLSNWRRTIFTDHSAKDIHYLDSSLFSTILQFELIFNEEEVIEDDDDFELF